MILSRIIPEGFIPLRQIIVTNSPKFILLKFVFSSATSKENPSFFFLFLTLSLTSVLGHSWKIDLHVQHFLQVIFPCD